MFLVELLDDLSIRLKLFSRSHYVLAARYVLQRISLKYVKELVYERPLDTEIPTIKTKVPVEVRTVSIEDIKSGTYQGIRLASGDDPFEHRKTRRRMKAEDVCVIAAVEDAVAGFCWLCFREKKYEPAIEREETFRDDEALIYDIVVLPEFRKKHICEKLNEKGMHLIKSKDFKKVLGYIQADNIPSVKSFERMGFYPTKIITCLRIFKFKRIKAFPISRHDKPQKKIKE